MLVVGATSRVDLLLAADGAHRGLVGFVAAGGPSRLVLGEQPGVELEHEVAHKVSLTFR
jgi:hypothetical protein